MLITIVAEAGQLMLAVIAVHVQTDVASFLRALQGFLPLHGRYGCMGLKRRFLLAGWRHLSERHLSRRFALRSAAAAAVPARPAQQPFRCGPPAFSKSILWLGH